MHISAAPGVAPGTLEKVLCVLGLGSNRPYRELSCRDIIAGAANSLQEILGECRLSPLYTTAPLYVTSQPPFVNAALSGFFCTQGKNHSTSARTLLEIINRIEAQYGRNRTVERRWGERSLDIDILLFGNYILHEGDLVIPHPRLNERAFALQPLLDVQPNAVEPGTGKRYHDIYADLNKQEQEIVPY